jgi:hypothetical protein
MCSQSTTFGRTQSFTTAPGHSARSNQNRRRPVSVTRLKVRNRAAQAGGPCYSDRHWSGDLFHKT